MRYPMSVEMVNEYGAHAVRVAIAEHEAMLDAAEVDGLIEELGKIRAHMQPAVATQPSRTHQYLLEIDPCWYIERNPLFDASCFSSGTPGSAGPVLRFPPKASPA